MIKTALTILVFAVGTMAFIGTDTDDDGLDDSFTIEILGVTYQANRCIEEILHASNQLTDAGTVEICNNETQLFVKVTARYGFQNSKQQVAAWANTDEADLPVSPGGIKIGNMPYKSRGILDGNTWGFVVTLADMKSLTADPVDCNAQIFVYIHANVIDLNGKAQTSFGGNLCYNAAAEDNILKRWYCKVDYQAQCPDSPPSLPGGGGSMQICETAFAYGTHVLSSKFNPDNLRYYEYGMKTNRWGWFTNIKTSGSSTQGELSYTIWSGAGRNRVDKATDVGTVVFTYTTAGGTPSIQIQVIMNGGVTVNEYHAYVGDDPCLKAPAPGAYTDVQYPPEWVGESWTANKIFKYTHEQNVGGETVDLIDDDGQSGVWVGLHLVACRQVPI